MFFSRENCLWEQARDTHKLTHSVTGFDISFKVVLLFSKKTFSFVASILKVEVLKWVSCFFCCFLVCFL